MAAVGEANFAEVGRRWNFDMVCALAWFDLLEKMGYEFHDSEIQIRERAQAYCDERRREAEERAAQEAEADEDDDPDEGEIGDGFAYAEDQMDAEEEALEGEDGLADEQFGDELSDGDLTDADLSVGDLSTDDPATTASWTTPTTKRTTNRSLPRSPVALRSSRSRCPTMTWMPRPWRSSRPVAAL